MITFFLRAASVMKARVTRPLFAGSVLLVGGALFASTPGCEECADGVLVNGVCEGRCDPSACLEGNVCVGNRCALVCSSHNECYSPKRGQDRLQGCVPQKTDAAPAEPDPTVGLGAGPEAYVCTDLDKAPNIGKLCPFGDADCAASACPDGTPCDPATGEGSCDALSCKPMDCISSGEADAEAYCTTVDCTTDADCGPGLYCGIRRSSLVICGTDKGTAQSCAADAECLLGGSCVDGSCCIDPSQFTANGGTFQEGPGSLLRSVCLEREPCAPCANATDCSLADDMQCVDIGGFSACAKTCAADIDCPDDYFCAGGYCVPRTQTCKPPTTGNFCFNCLSDLDCGPAGPANTVACAEGSAGQRACFDYAFPDACTVDADCPLSPSGKPGECLDDGEGLAPGDDAYHFCYLPFLPGPSKFQCWPD